VVVRGTIGGLNVSTASGDVEADRIEGALNIKSASGDTRVQEVLGGVNVQTASGDIELEIVRGAANVNSASELLAVPTFSTSAPVLCLATIKVSGTAITQIYDTRTFTTSVKEFVTVPTTAVALGQLAQVDGAGVKQMATGATVGVNANVRGVVVATNGSTSASTPNAILAIGGPAFVKVTDAGGTAGQYVENSTGTAGYATTSATGSTAIYGNLGLARNTTVATATCTATPNAANCIGSTYVDVMPR